MLALHTEVVRSGLGGEGLVFGNHDDCLVFRHQADDPGEMLEQRFWDFRWIPATIGEKDMVWACEYLYDLCQLVGRNQGGVQAVCACSKHGKHSDFTPWGEAGCVVRVGYGMGR